MKYCLKTAYPCLIKTMKEYVELEENDTLQLEDESIIFIYPQSAGQIPFYINLNNPVENAYFSVINQNDDKLLILEPIKKTTYLKKEILSFGNKTCTVSLSKSQASFENDDKKIIVQCQASKEAKIFKVKNFACLQLQNDLYTFSVSDSKLSHFSGDEFVFDGNKLRINKTYNDSLNRQKSAEYEFSDTITTLSENYTHSTEYNDDLLPYRLMESIKAKDFNFAYECLSNSLKDKIEQDQIKDFFGNFNVFLPLSTNEFLTLSNDEKNYVKIDINKNKVEDISIDRL